MFRSLWIIASWDVRRTLRQKETLLWIFVMPVLFFWFMGTMTGGHGGGGAQLPRLALWQEGQAGFLGDELALRLEARGFEVVQPESREQFDRYSRRVVIPDGFTAGVIAGEPQAVELLRRRNDLNASYDQLRVGRAVYTLMAHTLIAQRPLTAESYRDLAKAERALGLNVAMAGEEPPPVPQGFKQTVPGTTVMFTLLVLLTSGATSLVVERREGTLRRLASAPLSGGQVVLGKWLGQLILGLIQISFGLLAGALLFDVHWGSSPLGLALTLGAWAAFCASLAVALGNVSRTEGQAAGVGVVTTMALAALGGCWWPIEVTPLSMQQVASWLPTGWAMESMHSLVSFGRSAEAVLPQVGLMLGAAIVIGYGCSRRFRYG